MTTALRSCTALLMLLLAWGMPARAQAQPQDQDRRILLLQSLDRGNLTMDGFTGKFRLDVDQRSSTGVTFMQAVVNPSGFATSPQMPIVDYLSSAFAGQPKPDLVVTIGGPAAAFARKHADQLFPATPLLFTCVSTRYLAAAPLGEHETAVAADNDMAAIVDDILRLFPRTTTVFMVMGSGPLGRFWRAELERDFQRFGRRVTFVWSDDLSFAEILERVARLPPHSAVYFLTFGTDGKGGTYAEDRVLAEIKAAANAPMFGALSPEIGHGIVGGSVMDVERQASVAANVAIQLLDGQSPATVRTPPQKVGPPVFDWRELQRWQVDERLLPAGSIVRFRAPGVWDRFKGLIVTGIIVLIGQTFLIGTLLLNRAKRRRVEQLLRDNVADLDVARGSLSSLSRRLMEAQEQERTRVARELHDDISQRMSFLAMDLARLRSTISADASDAQAQAQTLYNAVVALGRDVQGISHRLHSSNIDRLGLSAAARGVCTDIATRHQLQVDYVDEHVPSRVPLGVAICLFRVLQESLSNTVKHAGARHCRVVLRGSADALELNVVDDGRGFDADVVRKGQGLGLISMEERLKLVNGTVVIESTVGGGTTLRARAPLAARPAPPGQAVSPSAERAVRSTTA